MLRNFKLSKSYHSHQARFQGFQISNINKENIHYSNNSKINQSSTLKIIQKLQRIYS